MQLLRDIKNSDPNFSVSMDTNENGRISSMIWYSWKNKLDYISDAVTFDTTYRTNLHNILSVYSSVSITIFSRPYLVGYYWPLRQLQVLYGLSQSLQANVW